MPRAFTITPPEGWLELLAKGGPVRAPRPQEPRVIPAPADSSMLDAVLELARRGFAVLPLHTMMDGVCSCGQELCRAPAKHPRTRNGVHDATRDAATLRGWWGRWPGANVAIATGTPSGVVVIDLDGPGARQTLEALGPIPRTLTVKTGRGEHLFFRAPSMTVRNSASVVGLHIDVRGEGGYVVAAPSLHASGARYECIDAHEPALMPGWLLARLRGER